jgi:colanic acid/amylovoran biosynthesis glycosyltransferase
MKRPCVAHAIRSYLPPTETFVGNQIQTLEAFSPVVVCYRRGASRFFDVDQMYVIEDHTTGAQTVLGRLAYSLFRSLMPGEVEQAVRWLESHAPVLWHFHFAVDAAFFLPLYRRLALPAVVSCYGYDVSSFPNLWGGLGKRYLHRVFREMDYFLAMSEDMRKDLLALGVPDEKIIVHYHGIHAARFRYEERTYENGRTYRILCVGSLEPKKGQHHLLRAVAALRNIRPDIDVRVTLVGKGPLQSELEQIIAAHGLADRVELTGYVPHLDPRLLQYYHSADVFVHFSTTQPNYDKEGIPGTIVEAMASGLPVVTTRHAGIPEVITDGVHGVLLDEQDTEGILRSLVELYDHPDRRRQLGQAAARHALRQLDLDVRTRKLEHIYELALQKKVRRHLAASGLSAPRTWGVQL